MRKIFEIFLKVSSLEQICGILINLRDFKVSDYRFWTRKSLTLQLVFWKSLGYSVIQFWKVRRVPGSIPA